MGFQINKDDINAVINCVPEAIERVLKVLQLKIEKYMEEPRADPSPIKNSKGKISNIGQSVNQMYQNQYQNQYEQYDPRYIQQQQE